ncbi:hypothetical protein RND81_05G141400 [Saponaria officinalis]|uniref:Exonuclease domain-containing protein n=1 Tax=Saponaria officinalis TaxID=3572 RepID=A0AAW1KXI6_SAPOF
MRTVPMCFTVFRVPRCNAYSWVNTWWNGFHTSSRACKEGSNFRLLSSSVCEQAPSRRWSRRPITTRGDGISKKVLSSAANIRHGITDDIVSSVTTNLNINIADNNKIEQIQCIDVNQLIAENKDLAEHATFIVFDLETTGFMRSDNIIEIALRDLEGGENSTFHTLVNPGRHVPNKSVHKISTEMVSQPGVPSMKELIPILLAFVESRRKPEGYVILIAHNAWTFDVRFLIKEFGRYSITIPSHWLFLDTLPISRELMKKEGVKGGTKLQDLCVYFGIESKDPAHRAMADVNALALVLNRLSFKMNLTRAGLVERAFTASQLMSRIAKTKKNST